VYLEDITKRWTTNTADATRARDLVVFLSGQNTGGGLARGIGGICKTSAASTSGFCVMGGLSRSFPYPLQNQNGNNWDVFVFLHEIGHCFGGIHTHDTGDDDCFLPDYSGPGACTMRRAGTIMSYCHQCSGGLSNINLRFSERNKTQIAAVLAGPGSCVTACSGTNSPTLTTTTCSEAGAAALSWTAVTANVGYLVYRDDGSGAVPVPRIGNTATNITTFIDTTASSPNVYSYHVRPLLTRIDAVNGNTTIEGPPSNNSLTRVGKTPTPTSLTANRNQSDQSVTLEWAAVPTATVYQVYRKLGTDAETRIATDLTATVPPRFVDTNLPTHRLGNYRVTAGAGSCESDSSTTASVGLGVFDLTTTLGTRSDGVMLSWSPVPGAIDHKVYRITGDNPATIPTVQIGATTSTTYLDTNAATGEYLIYAVVAVFDSGDADLGRGSVGWRNVAAPSNIAATDGTQNNGVTLSWRVPSGAKNIKIFRATTFTDPELLKVVTPNITRYIDGSATPGVAYFYSLKATCALGESILSSVDQGWSNLTAPANFSASDGTSDLGVNLSWIVSSGAIGYKVFRAEGDRAALQIGAPTSSTFLDTSANIGTVYRYWVKASCALGDSEPSIVNTGWRNFASPSNLSASDGTSYDGVTVRWSGSAGASSYKIFRGVGTVTPSQVGTSTSTTFFDSLAVPGTLYIYTAKGVSAAGDSAMSNADTGWRNLSTPTSLEASDGTNSLAVRVTWKASLGAATYKVFRSQAGGAAVQIGSFAGLVYNDLTAVSSQSYNYFVRASCTLGDSGNSNTDSGWRALSAPTSLAASDGISDARVQLVWVLSPNATGYKVYRSLGSGMPTLLIALTANGYADTSGSPGIKYTYFVSATCALGESTLSTSDTGWRTILPPTGLTASDGTFSTKVAIRWTETTGAINYLVYRKLGSGTNMQVGKSTTTNFDDTTAIAGLIYDYSVKGACALGNSLASNVDTGFKSSALIAPNTIGKPGSGSEITDAWQSGFVQIAGHEGNAVNNTATKDQTDAAVDRFDPTLVMQPIDFDDPAWSLDCENPSDAAAAKAIELGSRDLDQNGEPDLCQHARGDLDLSGTVDESDLALLLMMIGTEHAPMGDFNNDGEINATDIRLFSDLMRVDAEKQAKKKSKSTAVEDQAILEITVPDKK